MGIYSTRYNFEWKPVKGNFRQEEITCPRCNNKVQYQLCFDGDGFGFPGILTYKFNKQYAYKCPICPNFEVISNEVVKAILRS
jgi:hypothetical protein